MSTLLNEYRAFAGGILLGLVFAGVTMGIIGATRRARKLRLTSAEAKQADHAPFIDGVHPLRAAVLDARPQPEANIPGTLASERPDFSPMSQRW
jgi:hypothetical protein